MTTPACPDIRPLRIAVPKGRLEDAVFSYVRNSGLPVPHNANARQLTLATRDGQLEYILAKPSDVPTFVAYGGADAGFAGLDSLREVNVDVLEPYKLPMGFCRLSLAGDPAWRGHSLHLADHLRVATKYTRIASAYFTAQGINAEIIRLNGSVELAPLTGLSDLILDLVETGNTLRANGLVELQRIMECQIVVVVNRSAYRLHSDRVNHFLEALRPAPNPETGTTGGDSGHG